MSIAGIFPPQSEDPTWKEGFDLGADVADPQRAQSNRRDALCEPTPLPPDAVLPGWASDAGRYYRAIEQLGRCIATALTEGLGMAPEALLAFFSRGNSTLRLIHYPERPPRALAAMPVVEGQGQTGRRLVGVPHCDNGFVTLLWQDDVGGLQVRVAPDVWQEVPPQPGALVVNFGRLLSDWSGGRIRATEHRIVGGTRSRYSIPFFFEPAVDARIDPPGGDPAQAYVYGDRLWSRMQAFVEFQGLTRYRSVSG